MSKKITVFIASGGTGGHIIPARCLAQELVNQGYKVVFLADKKYLSYIKEEDKFSEKIIASSKLEKSLPSLVKASFLISLGVIESCLLFLRYRPKNVVAFGGYATFPVLIAALICRVKIILHEQNSHLGKVNRLFAKYASSIALSFAKTSGIAKESMSKTVLVGNLVRSEILQLHQEAYALPELEDKKEETNPDMLAKNRMGYNVLLASDFYQEEKEKKEQLFNILIIGGSGGARIFSDILPKAFFNLGEHVKEKIHVIQQCRKEFIDSTFAQYKSFNINATIDVFFEDMPKLLREAHLVIGRAGSSSIFEFCAAKKPMILVPFALSADDHQKKNAQYFEEQGAAIVVAEKDFTINKINEILKKLIGNQNLLQKMSQNAAQIAVLEATTKMAKLVIENGK